jgi:hypothetical protein
MRAAHLLAGARRHMVPRTEVLRRRMVRTARVHRRHTVRLPVAFPMAHLQMEWSSRRVQKLACLKMRSGIARTTAMIGRQNDGT